MDIGNEEANIFNIPAFPDFFSLGRMQYAPDCLGRIASAPDFPYHPPQTFPASAPNNRNSIVGGVLKPPPTIVFYSRGCVQYSRDKDFTELYLPN